MPWKNIQTQIKTGKRWRAAAWKAERKGAAVSAGLLTRRHMHPCGTVATEMKTWNSQLIDTPSKNQVTTL